MSRICRHCGKPIVIRWGKWHTLAPEASAYCSIRDNFHEPADDTGGEPKVEIYESNVLINPKTGNQTLGFAEMPKITCEAASSADGRRGWRLIETAPKDGSHILAADFSGRGVGFGGDPQQSFQCVVHWWEWCDGTHQDEWGWYPSTGSGENPALTSLTHWKPLEELAAPAPVLSGEGGK